MSNINVSILEFETILRKQLLLHILDYFRKSSRNDAEINDLATAFF